MARPRKSTPEHPIGTASTTRLRKLSCAECGYLVRCSRAMIERGLPGCCCGGVLVPATFEDAQLAHAAGHLSDDQLAAHPEWSEYQRQLSSILHGQASHVQRGRATQQPEGLAWARLLLERQQDARAAQLAALADHQFGGPPVEDPMPF